MVPWISEEIVNAGYHNIKFIKDTWVVWYGE